MATESRKRRLDICTTMWFLPRQSGLVCLAIVAAAIVVLATGFEVEFIFGALGGLVLVVLLLAIVFDLWKRPER